MKHRLLLICTLVLPCATGAHAYVQLVHQRITEAAFNRLQIDFTHRLGIARDQGLNGFRPIRLMSQGADDEDQNIRSINHFYDPAHDAPLTVLALFCTPPPGSNTAPAWALGSSGLWNEFSLKDANDHYRKALVSLQKDIRTTETARLFLTLGHVVHLVQDMAQPEHTRNDQHLPHTELFLSNGTKASLYEEWGIPNIASTDPAQPPIIDYGGYPDVALPDYASYFHTPERSATGGSLGRGLADFSNRSFVTQDTNYGERSNILEHACFTYQEPALRDATARIQTVRERVLLDDGTCCRFEEVDEGIFTSSPKDYYTGGTEVGPFHAFVSSVDLETRKYNPESSFYSLSDASFQTRAAMLIPRAVGYSAGLVERFFRGRISSVWTRNNDYTYDLTLTNSSPEPLGADASVTAIYVPGQYYFIPPTGDDAETVIDGPIRKYVPTFAGLGPGGSVTIPRLTVPALDRADVVDQFERRVAVTGTLGSETAVIGDVLPARDERGLRMEFHCNHPLVQFFTTETQYDSLPLGDYLSYAVFNRVGCFGFSCFGGGNGRYVTWNVTKRSYLPDRLDYLIANPSPGGYVLRVALDPRFWQEGIVARARFFLDGKLVQENSLEIPNGPETPFRPFTSYLPPAGYHPPQ